MNKKYENKVLGYLPEKGEFNPLPFHNKEGDCLEFLAEPDPFIASRINNFLTVYHSQNDGEVIGFMIKGYARLRQYIETNMPGFAVEIHDGKVSLAVLFKASWWSSIPADQAVIQVQVYERLNQYAEKIDTEIAFA